MRRWALGIGLGVAGLLIVSAGILCQDDPNRLKPFGGAILAIVAPISIGFFIGFLFGFDPDSGEKTFLAKCIKILLGLLAGATLASLGDAWRLTEKYLPQAADDLSLTGAVLLLLFPTFFVPSFVVGYLWQGKRLTDLTDLLKLLDRVVRPEWVTRLVLHKNAEEQETILDRYKEKKSELLGRFPDEVPALIPAMILFKDGDYEGALRRLENVRLSTSEENQASLIVGASLMKLGRYEGAIRTLSTIENASGFAPGVYILLARCYLGAGNLDKAQEYCSRYLAEHPGDREAATLQLEVRKRSLEENASEEGKAETLNEAKQFAEDMVKQGVFSRKEILKLWPGLIPEEINEPR